MKYILGTALMVVIGALRVSAQEVAPPSRVKNEQVNLSIYGLDKGGSRRVRPWSEAVGELVVVEGLAWGVHEKGLGQRVILDGGHIYVRGDDLPQGKLVRVAGALRLGKMKAAPKGAQGYSGAFEYFFMEADRIEQLKEVGKPYLAEPAAKE